MANAYTKIGGMYPLPVNPNCADIQKVIDKLKTDAVKPENSGGDWPAAFQMQIQLYTEQMSTMGCFVVASQPVNSETATQTPAASATTPANTSVASQANSTTPTTTGTTSNKTLVIVLIAGGVLVIGGIAYFLIKRKK